MSQIKFYTGIKDDLDTKTIENGAIYFVPITEEHAFVAYDMNDERYFVNAPYITTYANLDQNWTPNAGEVIVVTDAYIENNQTMPNIKIGNGIQNAVELRYVHDTNEIALLRATLNNHIQNSNIHHTITVDNSLLHITPTGTV